MTSSHTSSISASRLEGCSDTWKCPSNGRLREFAQSLAVASLISLPMLFLGGMLISNGIAERKSAEAALLERFGSHDRLIASPPKEQLSLESLVSGRALFVTNCAVCHNTDGTGKDGLGKDLTKSWFVTSLNDEELSAFVVKGRPQGDPLNTSGIPMPPKGGHPELTDADMSNIVAYMRGIQDSRRMPALPALVLVSAPVGPTTEAEKAQALAAAGGDAELAEYIAHGTKLFGATCAACHGKEARGLQNLGKDLTRSEFSRKLDDDGLLAFLKRGRDPSDPLNTSKVGMPPKGGNPALSDDDLLDIISYMRSLQKQAAGTP